MGSDGVGPGFWVDKNLNFGSSSDCETYENNSLVKPTEKCTQFAVCAVEVWALVRDAEKFKFQQGRVTVL